MTLDSIDWNTLTPVQAARLLGPAGKREQALARRWSDTDAPADYQAWMAALQLEEDLRVYVICGGKP